MKALIEHPLSSIVHSLGIRLLIPLFLTVGVVLTIHAMISFRSTKEHFLRFVEADIDHYGELIKRATHDGMLLNLKEDVQATIERLGEGPELSAIRVYDLKGTTMMSAQEEEIGQADRSCLGHVFQLPLCRGGGGHARLWSGEAWPALPTGRRSCVTCRSSRTSLRVPRPLCHAHPADQKVLGILEVEMSMEPLELALQTSQRQFVWTTLILILVVGVVAAVFIRRLVHRPVMQLYEGTLRIAGGDLDDACRVARPPRTGAAWPRPSTRWRPT